MPIAPRRRPGRLRLRWPPLPLVVGVVVGSLLVSGYHWGAQGWKDKHIGYPARPTGYSQIVATFGQPCNASASAVWMDWKAADELQPYHVHFHRKLGGMGTEVVSAKGGLSTNLDNDVHGHILQTHNDPYVKRGIWGYNCRYIKGTTTWSTHAWGIAVDVSAAHEHYPGHYHSHVNYKHAFIWDNHGWYWGKNFGDAMHFQFADGY